MEDKITPFSETKGEEANRGCKYGFWGVVEITVDGENREIAYLVTSSFKGSKPQRKPHGHQEQTSFSHLSHSITQRLHLAGTDMKARPCRKSRALNASNKSVPQMITGPQKPCLVVELRAKGLGFMPPSLRLRSLNHKTS